MGWEQGRAPLAHQAFWQNASQTHPVGTQDSKRNSELELHKQCRRATIAIILLVIFLINTLKTQPLVCCIYMNTFTMFQCKYMLYHFFPCYNAESGNTKI